MSEENAESLLPKNLMQVGDKMAITVKYVVPSLNALFAMNHWQRAKARKQTAAAFELALSPEGVAFLTPTTFAGRESLTVSAMREQLSRTIQQRLTTSLARKKLLKERKKQSSR